MSNVPVDLKLGSPSVVLKWPKNAQVVKTAQRQSDGRWKAILTVNGTTEELPGTHPTEADCQATISAYVAERT